jgi:hypothetical protein
LTNDTYGTVFANLSDVLGRSDINDDERFPPGAGPYADAAGQQKWHQMSKDDQNDVSRSFSDIGKVLAAYIEGIQHKPGTFD